MTDSLLEIDLQIDRVVHQYEQALRRGEAVCIEDFADAHPTLGMKLVRELLLTEMEYRQSLQLPIDWDEYTVRFPEAATPLRAEQIAETPAGGQDTSGNSLQDSVVDSTLPPGSIAAEEPPLTPLEISDYVLESQLGRGGQGEVFLARQRSLDRRVAVKLLTSAGAGDPQSQQRFLREAKTLAQTSHPQIVTIHGIGRTLDGELFLVMEFIDGRDLARQIADLKSADKKFEIRAAVEIAVQIAGAVAHAHSRGVIHRDLKPSNVLWHDLRGPVVTDFGMAKDLRSADALTLTEQMMGTPTYMAPEQAHRQFGEISVRTDVYGLTATLHALLTGQPPIPPGPIAEVLQRLTNLEPVADPRRWRPEIPAALSAICLKGLAKFPRERYSTIKDLSLDLQRWLQGEFPSAADLPRPVLVEPNRPKSEVSPDPENLLHAVWDQLDPELQDAFSLAYNKKRRAGSNRISTRDLFEALARLGTGPLKQVFNELPQGAMPEPADASVAIDRSVLQDQPLLSDCVRDSLAEFRKLVPGPQKVTPVDLFVDVAKHGHGPSVVKLREHGVDPGAMERIVQQLGLRVIRRETLGQPARPGGNRVENPAGNYLSDEHVQFSVYRPKVIPPETWQPLLAFAHLSELPADSPPGKPDPVAEVQRQAEQILGAKLPAFQALTSDSSQPIPRSGELTFVPFGEGLEFNPPQRSFLWKEPVHREEFRFKAAAHLDGQTVRGRLSIYLGRLLIAELSIVTRVDRNAGESVMPESANRTSRFRRIYACVSRLDRNLVAEFQQYADILGDEVLTSRFDRVAPIAEIEQKVQQADVFQLYWSHNALSSPEMKREWKYALSLQRPDFIRSMYWEEPFPAAHGLPPPELLAIGFQKVPLRQPMVAESNMVKPLGRTPDSVHRQPMVENSSIARTRGASSESFAKKLIRVRPPRSQIHYDASESESGTTGQALPPAAQEASALPSGSLEADLPSELGASIYSTLSFQEELFRVEEACLAPGENSVAESRASSESIDMDAIRSATKAQPRGGWESGPSAFLEECAPQGNKWRNRNSTRGIHRTWLWLVAGLVGVAVLFAFVWWLIAHR